MDQSIPEASLKERVARARVWKVMRLFNDALFSASISTGVARSMLKHGMDHMLSGLDIMYMRYYPSKLMVPERTPIFVFPSKAFAEEYAWNNDEGGDIKYVIAECIGTNIHRPFSDYGGGDSWVHGTNLPGATLLASTIYFEEFQHYVPKR